MVSSVFAYLFDVDGVFSVGTVVRSLNILSSFILSQPNNHDYQMLLPSLFVPLQSTKEIVRGAAVASIQALYTKHGNTIFGAKSTSLDFYGENTSTIPYFIN